MKKILCALALTVAASCGALGTSTGYKPSNVAEAVTIVVDRHDGYVSADANLDDAQRAAYLGESAAVRSLLSLDPIPKAEFNSALPPVLDRTDAYVLADTSLTAPQQVQRSRTTALLRKLIQSNP